MGTQHERLRYVTRTLSRTKRKDFENYVVNAVWNRLDPGLRARLKPVTQQAVRTAGGRLYLIDLFFPQLNLAIEADETHHLWQKAADAARMSAIIERLQPAEPDDMFAALSAVSTSECDFKRVKMFDDVSGAPLGLNEVDAQIDAVVAHLTQLAATADCPSWDELDLAQQPRRFYADRTEFAVSDGVLFASRQELAQVLFGQGMPSGGGYFRLSAFQERDELASHKLWLPQLKSAAGKHIEWDNQLSVDGRFITERLLSGAAVDHAETPPPAVTFAQVKDPFHGRCYRFIGVFEFDQLGDGSRTFRCTADRFPLLGR